MDEELPKGVTTQKAPDGRITVWFFPVTWSKGIYFLLGIALLGVTQLVILGLLKAPFWAALFVTAAFLLSELFLCGIYFYCTRTRLCVTGVAVYKDSPFGRRGFAWDEVSSLCIFRFQNVAYLHVRNKDGKRIIAKLGSTGFKHGVEDKASARFLCELIEDKSEPAFARRMQEALKEEAGFAVSPPPLCLRDFFRIFLPAVPLALVVAVIVLSGTRIPLLAVAALTVMILMGGILVLAKSVSRSKFAPVKFADAGISSSGNGRGHSWSEVEKVEYDQSTTSGITFSPPVRVWFTDSEKPLVILPGYSNYNLLVAFLKHKKLI